MKSVKEMTDEELFTTYQDTGKAEYFQEIYDRYYQSVRATVVRLLGASSIADDIADAVQTVFLRFHETADRFQHGRRVKPWLYTIAERTCISYARHETRETYYRSDNKSLSERVALHEPVTCETPCTLAQRKELAVNVRAIFERLPPDEKVVMELAYFQNKTCEQIADELGICVATVKNRTKRARTRIKLCLSHTYRDSHGEPNGQMHPGCLWADSVPDCELAIN